MSIEHKIGLILVGFLLHWCASSVHGVVLTHEFQGTIRSVIDTEGVLDPLVVVGSTFTGTFWYETEGEHDLNLNPSIAELNLASGGIMVQCGSTHVQDDRMGLTIGNSSQDYYVFSSVLTDHPVFEHLTVQVELRDFSGTALDDTSIPSGPIDLADFPDRREFYFSEEMPGVEIFGEITSLTMIPEPSAALCLLGLAAPLVRRRSLGSM